MPTLTANEEAVLPPLRVNVIVPDGPLSDTVTVVGITNTWGRGSLLAATNTPPIAVGPKG